MSSTFSFLLSLSFSPSLETQSLIGLGLTNCIRSLRSAYFCARLQVCATTPGFFIWALRSELGPHVCTANTSLIELSTSHFISLLIHSFIGKLSHSPGCSQLTLTLALKCRSPCYHLASAGIAGACHHS